HAGIRRPGRIAAGRGADTNLFFARTPSRADTVGGTARGLAELPRNSASQRRLADPRADERLRGARRPGPLDPISRPHARHYRSQEFSVGATARARFLQQDPEQYPEPDPG